MFQLEQVSKRFGRTWALHPLDLIVPEGRTTVPQIFIDGQAIGGCDDLYALDSLKPDLAIGTTPVVQRAKERGTPALYFTNLISARPLMGVAGAGSNTEAGICCSQYAAAASVNKVSLSPK